MDSPGRPGTRERFAALSRQLRSMAEIGTVAAIMKTPPEKFSDAIDTHRSRSRRNEFPFDEAKTRAGIETGPANEAEVLIQTANLLAAEGKDARCAQQQYVTEPRTKNIMPVLCTGWVSLTISSSSSEGRKRTRTRAQPFIRAGQGGTCYGCAARLVHPSEADLHGADLILQRMVHAWV
jgi:hypothetical protein